MNLKHLKIAVEPLGLYGDFAKKIQKFNNSVGYASQENGGNLVVTEQWLENPKWNIYILSDDSEVYSKIKDYLVNSKCEYIPYIGIFRELVEVKESDVDDILFTYNANNTDETEFEYNEVLPTALDKQIGYTNYKPFIFTNKNLILKDIDHIYVASGKNIFFY